MISLWKYLRENDITQRSFASKLGSTPTYLCLLLHGKVTPGLRIAHKIECLTNGVVKVEDWIKPEWRKFLKNLSEDD